MIALDPAGAARSAKSVNESRPATAILHDVPDVRLVVFRLGAGQVVPPHSNPSTVLLTVLEGTGTLSGSDGEQQCHPGQMVVYAPGELHGMRATHGPLMLLATITPRPGAR